MKKNCRLANTTSQRAPTKRILEKSCKISRHVIEQSLQYLHINSHQCRVLQPPPHQYDFKNPILAGVHSFSELLFTSRFSTSLSSDGTWVPVDPGTSFTAAKFQVATKSRCQNSRLPKKCFISDGQKWTKMESMFFFQHLCLHIVYQWHIAARCRAMVLSCFGLWNDSRMDMSFTSVCLD